jgi:hypothetical protein
MYGCKFWQPGHIPSFLVVVEYIWYAALIVLSHVISFSVLSWSLHGLAAIVVSPEVSPL